MVAGSGKLLAMSNFVGLRGTSRQDTVGFYIVRSVSSIALRPVFKPFAFSASL
jgi:hypothetical protein